MKKLIFSLALCISLFTTKAQILSPYLGGGFTAMVERDHYPVGVIGLEGSSSEHWSIVGKFLLGGKNNISMNASFGNKKYWGAETDVRFYFKEVQNGFFLSTGFYFGRETFHPLETASIAKFTTSAEQGGLAFGFGFSQKVNEAISLQLSSSLGLDFFQSDARLRAGLGLTYDLL